MIYTRSFGIVCILVVNVMAMPKVVERLTAVVTTEVVAGERFVHTIESNGYSTRQAWTINGVKVLAEEYEEKLVRAELEERKKERALENQRLLAQVTFKNKARADVTKKVLEALLPDIESVLYVLKKHDLEQFAVFSSATIASQHAYSELKECIVRAKSVLNLDAYDHAQEIADVYHVLSDMPYRMQKFFESAVQEAIKRCDDTRVLKELLALVS